MEGVLGQIPPGGGRCCRGGNNDNGEGSAVGNNNVNDGAAQRRTTTTGDSITALATATVTTTMVTTAASSGGATWDTLLAKWAKAGPSLLVTESTRGPMKARATWEGWWGRFLTLQCHGQRRGQWALPSFLCCVLQLYMSPSLCLVIYRIVDCYFVIVIVIICFPRQVVSPVIIIVSVVVRH